MARCRACAGNEPSGELCWRTTFVHSPHSRKTATIGPIMPVHILSDLSRDVWTESFSINGPAWSVSKRLLRGGRREGVELVEVDNGLLRFKVVPTRGMSLWKGEFKGRRLGWDSPVRDGPVHPSLVRAADSGGIGWLQGFDEWLVRCGLSHNGAPF